MHLTLPYPKSKIRDPKSNKNFRVLRTSPLLRDKKQALPFTLLPLCYLVFE